MTRDTIAAGLALTALIVGVQHMQGAQADQLTSAGVRVHPSLTILVAQGRGRSPTFRALLDELDRSDWVVFVQSGSCQITAVAACMLHRVGAFDGARYLRIIISEMSWSDDEVIATIAHELQHAVEVATNPAIRDAADIRQLYKRIGYVAVRTDSRELYETPRAISSEKRVRRELRTERRLAQRPGRQSRR